MTRTGFYLRFADQLDLAANANLLAVSAALLANPLKGITDIVPSYVKIYLEFDAEQTSEAQVKRWVRKHQAHSSASVGGKLVQIPVRYDGMDLTWVAEQTGLSTAEVVHFHSQTEYRVFATGFTPGYPFLGLLNERLKLSRRTTPRALVPAHSVAMAGLQSGIYPLPSPGGWHVIGTALEQIYNPQRAQPFLLSAGDTVRFVATAGETPALPKALELLPEEPKHPSFSVEQTGLLDLPMDMGRLLGGRFGLAASGAMDARSARTANGLVGNPAHAPLLELTLTGPKLRVLAPLTVAFAGYGMVPLVNGEALQAGQSFALNKGDVLSFKPLSFGVRGYLALAGGLEMGQFYGSSSTDSKGLIGRALRVGDMLGVAERRVARAGRSFEQPLLSNMARVRLVAGPQYTPEAMQALCAAPFTLVSGDRMGLRLEGPQVPGGELISEATPLGAVQITTQGQPIVLLNDRGRIGGYAKPAIVYPADLPRLAQLRQGEKVRFVAVK